MIREAVPETVVRDSTVLPMTSGTKAVACLTRMPYKFIDSRDLGQ